MNHYHFFYVNLSYPFGKTDRKYLDVLHKVESDPSNEQALDAERCDDRKNNHIFKYHFNANGEDSYAPVYGIQTNEAILKTILQKCTLENLIIAATTSVYSDPFFSKSETEENDDIISRLDSCREKSSVLQISTDSSFADVCHMNTTLGYFLSEMDSYVRNVLHSNRIFDRIKTITIYPVEDSPQHDDMTACAINVASQIVRAKNELLSGDAENKIHFYLDSNGGKRQMMTIQTGMIRALQSEGINAEQILYSDFNRKLYNWGDTPVDILDAKAEYDIFDIVSGIDEFVFYGRAYKLSDYYRNTEKPIKKVLESINEMCQTFSTCFANPMVESVADVINEINYFHKQTDTTNLEQYIISQIEKDLGEDLLAISRGNADTSLFILPLIEWCYNKKFFQQAITLYVEKLPAWYVSKKIICPIVRKKAMDDNANFYEMMYKNTREDIFNNEIRQILTDNPAEESSDALSSFINRLESIVKKNHLDKSTFCKIKEELRNFYNKNGIRNNNGKQHGMPGSIQKYANTLINTNLELKRHKDKILAFFAETAGDANVKKRTAYIQGLERLSNVKELNLNSAAMDKHIEKIRDNYDEMGSRTVNNTLPKSLEDYISQLGYNSLVNEDSLEEKAIKKNPENKEDKSYTYIQKRRAILNTTDEYADSSLFPNTECSNKKALFNQIQLYYLAFKVIRNNSNHANGMSGINETLICEWLSEQGILEINSCKIEENTIQLNYTACDALLKKAIAFNKRDLLDVID